jgi:hypothetical protein
MFFRPVGDISYEQGKQLFEELEKYPRPEKGFYMLSDVAEAGRQSNEIIKDSQLMGKVRLYRALAYFNVSFHGRTLINIYLKVARTFKYPLADLPLQIFATEAEARAWIEQHRRSS